MNEREEREHNRQMANDNPTTSKNKPKNSQPNQDLLISSRKRPWLPFKFARNLDDKTFQTKYFTKDKKVFLRGRFFGDFRKVQGIPNDNNSIQEELVFIPYNNKSMIDYLVTHGFWEEMNAIYDQNLKNSAINKKDTKSTSLSPSASRSQSTSRSSSTSRSEKLATFFENNKIHLLTFLSSFLIMLSAFAVCGMYPFGDRQIMVIDAWHQYYPFLSEFHEKIQHAGSLLYNHNIGLGINFSLMRAYYTNSPLNWLSFFCPHAYLREFMMLATTMKIAFAATFMSMLLTYSNKKKTIYTMFFGMLYAFSTYFMGYYWCTMWLDSVALLPLIILGLHQVLRETKYFLYPISLGLAIISNYYIGYMICLFIVFYYLYLVTTIYRPKTFWEFFSNTLLVLFCSLFGVGLSAIVLLPVVRGMTLASASKFTFPNELVFKRPFIDVINRMLIGVEPAVVKGLPNITIGTLGLYGLYLYFKAKNIRFSKKIASLMFLVFMLLSTTTNVFDFIWHGMHYPNGIPFRFAFVFVFFMITIAYEGFTERKKPNAKDIGVFLAIMVIYILFSAGKGVNEIVALISVMTLCVYGLLLEAYASKKIQKETFTVILATLIFVESLGSSIYGVAVTGSSRRSTYRLYEEQVNAALAEMHRIDNGIYRTEMARIYTTNDSSLYGYRGASVFSSTLNANVTDFVRKLGAMGARRSNRYSLPMSSPILDSLFNIKYFIGRDELGNENFTGYTEIGRWENVRLMRNEYALSLGFFAPRGSQDYTDTSDNPFVVQENFYSKLAEEHVKIYDKQEITIDYENASPNYESRSIRYNYKLNNKSLSGKAHITFNASEDGDYYIYCFAPKAKKGIYKIYQDSTKEERKENYEVRRGIIVPTGQMKKGGSVTIELQLEEEHDSYLDIVVVKCDFHSFQTAFDKINNHPMEVLTFEDTHIQGRITAPENGYCLISIPYEKGWHATVNEKKVQPQSLKNALLLIPVKQGDNIIDLRYEPDGLKHGIIISTIATLLLILLYLSEQWESLKIIQKIKLKHGDK